MLRWMLGLASLCFLSALLGLGNVVAMASDMKGMLLTLTALSGAMLVSTFDAFETQAGVTGDADDET